MKKFQFSLGKVLDYKNQLVEKEKNNLAQLRMRMQRIENSIGVLQEEFQAVNDRLKQETLKGITIIKMKSYEYQLQNIRYQISQLEMDRKALEYAIEKQLRIVVSLTQEISGLEKLEEKQHSEYRMQEAKGQELLVAEFVSASLIRKKSLEISSC